MVWESSEDQFGRLKKKGRQKFNFFLKIRPPPPPREIPRSAPAFDIFFHNVLIDTVTFF